MRSEREKVKKKKFASSDIKSRAAYEQRKYVKLRLTKCDIDTEVRCENTRSAGDTINKANFAIK